MAETITIQVPSVTAAAIAPNPVTVGSAVLISVTVTTVSKVLTSEERRAGEYCAGEG